MARRSTAAAGLTAYWKVNHLVDAEVVDTRLQVLEVGGQEILTKDKVNLRLNLGSELALPRCVAGVCTAH